MATQEFLKRSIAAQKAYEALPDRIRAILSHGEWKARVKDYCIQRGLAWAASLAKSASTEGEYYEDLIIYYRQNYRIYPYHLADYIARVMRVTPFQYNCDLLYSALRDEKSYDFLPNFTAADILRLVGVGRNEYISIMNRCKAKRLMWRVNKALAKEMLPTEPVDVEMQPWWTVNVVNIGETEYRQLGEHELSLCRKACAPGGTAVQDLGKAVLQPLYKKGLIYLAVPISPTDHISIPPLEGFVSNKDSEKGEDKGDPLEEVLYGVFVATSDRASVGQLASILSVEPARLQAAVSVACRLGFAKRLPPGDSAESWSPRENKGISIDGMSDATDNESQQEELQGNAGDGGAVTGQGIALVVDKEVTSYLMMGALSPGLKRHAVTLFEGGRITGVEVIEDLIKELQASVKTAEEFEGEMQTLAGHAKALSCALTCIRAAGGARPIELLRKEPLGNLTPASANRVLSHAYAAVVPITPLPSPPLPLSPSRTGPTNFGATAEACTPWLQLALYQAVGDCPDSIVLACGQRFMHLPPQLDCCTHALLWPWDQEAVRAQTLPIRIEATFMLFTLNEYLSRTALIVQPLVLPSDTDIGDLSIACLPLPPTLSAGSTASLVDHVSGEEQDIQVKASLAEAVEKLGLAHAVGCIQFLQVSKPSPEGQTDSLIEDAASWVPLILQLGLPLQPDNLCQAVCRAAEEKDFLSQDARAKHAEGQSRLQKVIWECMASVSKAGSSSAENGQDSENVVELPVSNVIVAGGKVQRVDFSRFMQGPPIL